MPPTNPRISEFHNNNITNALLRYRIAKIEFETARDVFDHVVPGSASQDQINAVNMAMIALADARRALCDAIDKAVA